MTIPARAAVLYVDVASANPAPPYANWAGAARTIQDAIDAASAGDEVVVTNGVYQTGGRVVAGTLLNRIAVTKPVTVRSINGPAVTMIQGNPTRPASGGSAGIRCVYLTNEALLAGFTVRHGAHEGWGGGIWCESQSAVLTNCIISGNTAGGFAGGVYGGTIIDCTISENRAIHGNGGGAQNSVLIRCRLLGNIQTYECGTENICGVGGGGAADSRLYDCIISSNQADYHGGGVFNCLVENSTLTGNISGYAGGGAVGGSLIHCFVADNRAIYIGGGSYFSAVNRTAFVRNVGGQYGGGVSGGSVINSLVVSNSSIYLGGGAHDSRLSNCTVTGNFTTDSSSQGGGLIGGSANNCIVYFNRAISSGSNHSSCEMNYSCTFPLPAGGVANFTNNPSFADHAGANFRLNADSPCINSGNTGLSPADSDLDGRPRVIGRSVDVGAYEFQGVLTNQLILWLRQYGLPTDSSADNGDTDGDHFGNYQEWRTGTNPRDAASVLRLKPAVATGTDVVLTWESVAGRTYFLERATNLAFPASFQPVAGNIPGRQGTTSYTNRLIGGTTLDLYRIGVE